MWYIIPLYSTKEFWVISQSLPPKNKKTVNECSGYKIRSLQFNISSHRYRVRADIPCEHFTANVMRCFYLYPFPLHPLPSFLLLPVWLGMVAWILETFLLKKTLLYLFLFFQKHKCPFNVAQSVTHHLLPILDPCVLQGKLENSPAWSWLQSWY